MAVHSSQIFMRALEPASYLDIAHQLDAASRACATISPFAEPRGLSQHDAYAIQAAWNAARIARGERRIGYKVGVTSHRVRRLLGAQGPAYGMLFESMLLSDGGEVDISSFHSPRVEVELAFVIGTELSGPDCTLETVLRATDYIVAAFEIIDNRVESRLDVPVRATINDIIADNVASAGAVLGRVHIDAATTSLQRISAVLSRNGIIEDSGVSAIVGGHPAAGVASLVNHLALKGGTLLKDEVVLSGTFTSPLPVQRGDKIEADFDRCGSVSLTFR